MAELRRIELAFSQISSLIDALKQIEDQLETLEAYETAITIVEHDEDDEWMLALLTNFNSDEPIEVYQVDIDGELTLSNDDAFTVSE